MSDGVSLLLQKRDEKLKRFSEKIISDTKYPIIGVSVPKVREIAKEIVKSGGIPFPENGFTYYEECLLCGLVIAGGKADFTEKARLFYKYLPHIDSWGITDSVAAAFKDVKKNRDAAKEFIYSLLSDPLPYSRRFGIVLLLDFFTGEYFEEEHIGKILAVKTGEYYVDMAIAWYLSVLLVKNRDTATHLIETFAFPPFIHDKAIQKAVESFRVSEEDKQYLKKFKTSEAEKRRVQGEKYE